MGQRKKRRSDATHPVENWDTPNKTEKDGGCLPPTINHKDLVASLFFHLEKKVGGSLFGGSY